MVRSRTCTNPPPSNGGFDCARLGRPVQSTQCYLVDCPGNEWFAHVIKLLLIRGQFNKAFTLVVYKFGPWFNMRTQTETRLNVQKLVKGSKTRFLQDREITRVQILCYKC